MKARSAVCIATFALAYVLLIPGLTCLLFSAKASFMGMTIVDIEKSTFGAIHMLFEKNRWVAAGTILICSVIAPFVKLAVLLVSAYRMQVQGTTDGVSTAIAGVRRISKWATVDAFTASILVGFFVKNAMLHVELHKGFYCFVGYCILSVAGALLLEKPECDTTPRTRFSKPPLATACGLCLVSLGVLFFLASVPLFDVACPMIALKEQLSFVSLVSKLLDTSLTAAMLCIALAAVVPAADLACTVVEAVLGKDENPIAEWLQDFAMFDVFALALLVTANASAGLHASLTVQLLPGGKLFVACATLWLVHSVAFRSRASSGSSKDKLASLSEATCCEKTV